MRHPAYYEGQQAASILDNPYWPEYPKPAKGGEQEEHAANHFVDGYCDKVRSSTNSARANP